MNSSKLLKFGGMACTVIGVLVSIIGNMISDKRQYIEMDERINEAVNKRFEESSNE